MSFKDFKDAAPLIQAFFNTVTLPIADSFSARLADLDIAAKNIGGYPPADDFPYDLSLQFDALPKVPLLMLFNDKDEEFPAQCSVLFEKRVEKLLDMECLAMVGMTFCEYLKKELSGNL
jgi:dienelactone hydrolase